MPLMMALLRLGKKQHLRKSVSSTSKHQRKVSQESKVQITKRNNPEYSINQPKDMYRDTLLVIEVEPVSKRLMTQIQYQSTERYGLMTNLVTESNNPPWWSWEKLSSWPKLLTTQTVRDNGITERTQNPKKTDEASVWDFANENFSQTQKRLNLRFEERAIEWRVEWVEGQWLEC